MGAISGLMILAAISVLITTIPVYFLWNWLMPYIFGLPVITFMQALGLSLLSACLFKSPTSSSKKA